MQKSLEFQAAHCHQFKKIKQLSYKSSRTLDASERNKKLTYFPTWFSTRCLIVWITQCRTENILLEKAECFAKELGHLNFKGSNV